MHCFVWVCFLYCLDLFLNSVYISYFEVLGLLCCCLGLFLMFGTIVFKIWVELLLIWVYCLICVFILLVTLGL